jgi:hypothetical protein
MIFSDTLFSLVGGAGLASKTTTRRWLSKRSDPAAAVAQFGTVGDLCDEKVDGVEPSVPTCKRTLWPEGERLDLNRSTQRSSVKTLSGASGGRTVDDEVQTLVTNQARGDGLSLHFGS